MRLVLRGLRVAPGRTLVLSLGFGLGVAAQATLLGVSAALREESSAPAIRGGGDLVVTNVWGVAVGRLLLEQLRDVSGPEGSIRAMSPLRYETVHLARPGRPALGIQAVGGVPSLARATVVGAEAASWPEGSSDRAWEDPDRSDILRMLDAFRPAPDTNAQDWLEWLYFSFQADDAEIVLSCVAGPHEEPGRRTLGFRARVGTGSDARSYSQVVSIEESELLASAPDLQVGGSSVSLEGTRYRVELELAPDDPTDPDPLRGIVFLDASRRASLQPVEIRGARNWKTGYAIPVVTGPTSGSLSAFGKTLSFEGGSGYHDHNWGHWSDVGWDWGRIAGPDLSVVYARVFPPEDAADPQRLPGFVLVAGLDGLVRVLPSPSIIETPEPGSNVPRTIEVRASQDDAELEIRVDVLDTSASPLPIPTSTRLLQMTGSFVVNGRIGDREIALSKIGFAETHVPLEDDAPSAGSISRRAR